MKKVSRRGFLKGASVAVPAAAVVVVAPQLVKAAEPRFTDVVLPVPPPPDLSHMPVSDNSADIEVYLDAQIITLTGPTTGHSLYQKMKTLWKETSAIRYAFPIMAITPELFEMQDGWKLQNPHFLQNAGLIDDGYGNKIIGMLSLGQVFDNTQMLWAPADHKETFFMNQFQPFHTKGHVNEGIIFPENRPTLHVKYGGSMIDLGTMSGIEPVNKFNGVVRFPVFQQYDLYRREFS